MKDIIPIFVMTWRSLDGRGHRYCFLAIVLFLIVIMIRVLTPVYFAYVVAQIQDDILEPVTWLIIYACMFAAVRILEEFRFTTYVYFEQYFNKSIILTLLRRYYVLPRSKINHMASTEIAIIVDRGLGGLRDAMYNLIFTIGPLIIEALALVVILAYNLSIVLAIGVSALLAIFVAITYILTNRISILQTVWYQTAARNFKLLSECVISQETIRSMEKPDWIVKRYTDAADLFIRQVLNSLSPGIVMGVVQGGLLGVIVFTVNLAIIFDHSSGRDTIPLIVLANGLIIQIVSPLVQFAGAYRMFMQGLSSAGELVGLLKLKPKMLKLRHKRATLDRALEIRRVEAMISENRYLVYENVGIERSALTAIVGKTGTGKSTLARVMAGLMDYRGSIYLDKREDCVLYLSQNVDVFDTTLAENIALSQDHDKEKMEFCLQESGFTGSEISELSDRNMGEGGGGISEGQKRRLGIARMLYHEADVYIFDEPTASIDQETAKIIRATIYRLRDRSTVVVVTHDMKFCEIADHVVEIETIAERGGAINEI
ncbi:MAG: ABC transporter ATP-binding protein [Rhodobacteraceae bacterium]|nr:ABC transporter ATP-binding protein [Paracoccaceae bacterium]